jgi:hypothetical protein
MKQVNKEQLSKIINTLRGIEGDLYKIDEDQNTSTSESLHIQKGINNLNQICDSLYKALECSE